jgi:hypothetical protein
MWKVKPRVVIKIPEEPLSPRMVLYNWPKTAKQR